MVSASNTVYLKILYSTLFYLVEHAIHQVSGYQIITSNLPELILINPRGISAGLRTENPLAPDPFYT